MTEKFLNKYRIASARLQNWDYASEGAYYITVCTHDRTRYFGEIKDGKMILSHIGIIADIMWYEIKNHAKNVELGAFIVMPDHIHGIIFICGTDSVENPIPFGKIVVENADTATGVDATHASPQPLSTIVGSYKSAVSKHAHRLGFEFEWQSRFHDHIIRNEESYQRITDYIINNPANWKKDSDTR